LLKDIAAMDNTIPMKTPRVTVKTDASKRVRQKSDTKSNSRLLMVQEIVPMVTNIASAQLDDFSNRLAEEFYKLADQALRPEDAQISFDAHQLIKRNILTFYKLASGKINAALALEVSIFNTKKRLTKDEIELEQNSALQNFEEVESNFLLRHLSQSLEVISAESLVTLNILIGQVLYRTPIDVSQNPFRPEIFVRAIFQAWKELDPNPDSHLIVLRLLQPTMFLQLTSIYEDINQELMAQGIVPDKNTNTVGKFASINLKRTMSIADRDPYLLDKLRYVFSGKCRLSSANEVQNTNESDTPFTNENVIEEEFPSLGNLDKATIDFQFFETLIELQRDFSASFIEIESFSSSIRETLNETSANNLTVVERNKVELLARIFDYVFSDHSLRSDIKCLIAHLQIPLLRVALLDEEFFFREDHPARMLINILGSSGLILDGKDHLSDPLLEIMGDVIDRVQSEFDEQIELFSDVVADLEYFLKEEEIKAEIAISEPVQNALNAEKMRVSRELAEHDVGIRLETGEVAGFLETFFLEQWIRILTIAHSVKEEKPHTLENALKTMDDLIWSLKPKNSAKERQELISKLPSMLALLNAWLNAIRWDEPDRVIFFSKLAERHALMARAPLELSPRRQLEIAVNIAQRASNRRLDRFVQKKIVQTNEEALKQVDSLERGMWSDFTNEDETVSRFKLTWVSPKRTSFIFANRQGFDTFSITAEELVELCGQGMVTTVLEDAIMDRALVFSLRNLPL
jgi:hypothetical protein